MNRAWIRRRTKKGLAARQYASLQRQLRRAYTARQPLPIVLESNGVGCTLRIVVDYPEPPRWWEDETQDWPE